MTTRRSDDPDLVPIDAVARRFGLRASALRYYEERGLLQPASRHSGRRWYGATELRRLAIIHYWQSSGMMSLDEIAELLAGPSAARGWPGIVRERIDELRDRASLMLEAADHLEHVLAHHPDSPPDGCEHFEANILEPARGGATPDRVDTSVDAHDDREEHEVRQDREAGASVGDHRRQP